MRVVERELGSNRFNSMDQFVRAATKDEPLYDAVEVLNEGLELSLTDHGQLPYCDKDGHARGKMHVSPGGGRTRRRFASLR